MFVFLIPVYFRPVIKCVKYKRKRFRKEKLNTVNVYYYIAIS